MGLLAACGGAEPPELVIPTVAATADPNLPAATPLPTTTLPPPATVVPPTVSPQATATTQPPTPTLAPTLPPAPTAPPAPSPTPVPPEAQQPSGYRVAFVAANDTLNVRRRPDPNAAVVAELPADARGIAVAGEGQSVRGGGLWLPVDTTAGSGYVNSRFLTEDISGQAFCADPAVTELLSRLQTAIAQRDEKLLAELVHPTRGLRLRLNWWNEEVIAAEAEVAQIFKDR